jgi:2-polyprenyl-3-methyl-5-hydroxy-6-metoxy-1,4-benzoquinol methylase
MTCAQCKGADKLFSGLHVARELKKYRRKGPRGTTRTLIDALKAEGVDGTTLLDIGGGVGAIQHELLRAGADRATGADAAAEYLEAARQEAERLGHADRVDFHYGDFVEIADRLEAVDVVTLDRVICCYPDVASLVRSSVAKARRLYGVVYPRDVWWTKLGSRFLNLFLWASRNPFRVFVHSTRDVDALVSEAGLRRRLTRHTPNWQIVLYSR